MNYSAKWFYFIINQLRASSTSSYIRPTKNRRHFWQRNRRQSEVRMPLLFLMRLLHTPLPVRVVLPEEVRAVSVLVATGLIEAEIAALKSTSPYAASSMATVQRITDEGLSEIARMGDLHQFVKTSMRLARGLRLM
ncbi:hypothetical protein QFZ42_001766 [Variovorax paradoxus]|uniref:hypothetical protein n=1 Tax=Variovorax paradoxus TaxID=34073 RepID=UPI00278E445E|nr:hypothetical protein [Variovorax paradoxus]MDQ0569932.1 hypothetical protein [Variovorax paradoxus]